MNNQETKPEILNKLEELILAVENLLLYAENNEESQFHIDLCKNKLINLYNFIALYDNSVKSQQISKNESISKSDSYVSEKQDIEQSERIEADETVTEIFQQIEKKSEITESTEESVSEFIHEDLAIEETIVVSEQTHMPPIEDITSEKVTISEKQTISDKFQTESGSLNQRFQSEQKDNSISSRIQANPVYDLRKSIGINDRFSFINELFEGDKGMYDAFMDKVCSAESSEIILSVLNIETQQRKWTEKPAFAKINDLIQRYSITK